MLYKRRFRAQDSGCLKEILELQWLEAILKPAIKKNSDILILEIWKFYDAIVPIFLKENLVFAFTIQK